MGKNNEHYLEAMGGMDYSFFSRRVVLGLEYYYNGDLINHLCPGYLEYLSECQPSFFCAVFSRTDKRNRILRNIQTGLYARPGGALLKT